MPIVAPMQNNFSGGEFSNLTKGRSDTDRYKTSLALCKNFLPTIQGSLTRRPGTMFVSEVKDSSSKTRLIPFQYSTAQAYILEFGDQYIRFYKEHGQILDGMSQIYEIATPYLEAELFQLKYTQSADVLYLVHPNHAPKKLLRFDHDDWALQTIDFIDGPYGELQSSINPTYGVDVFQNAGDVISNITWSGGTATVTTTGPQYIPTGNTTVEIRDVQGAVEANGIWTVTRTGPTTFIFTLPSMTAYSSGGKMRRYIGTDLLYYNPTLNLSATLGSAVLTVNSANVSGAANNGSGLIRITIDVNHGLATGDVVTLASVGGTTEANGTWTITVINSTTFDLQGSAYVHSYTSGGTMTKNVFASTDVGRSIRLKDGANWRWGTIIAYTDPTSVTMQIRSSAGFSDTTLLEYRLGLWSDTTGWPSAVTFHEDRLVFSGSGGAPGRIDMSSSGDYENFASTEENGDVIASNAIAISINSNDVNAVNWIATDERGLLVGTVAAEWVIRSASVAEALSPTSVSAKKASAYGSADLQPVQAGKSTLYAQRSTKKIRELLYFYDVDGFRANDMTVLAEHILESGVTQLAYQKEPQSILWASRNDGQLVAMTYDRDLDSIKAGWSRHTIGGYSDAAQSPTKVESVAVIPSPDGLREELWVITKRWIDGASVRYVEVLTKLFEDDDEQRDAFFVDCGLTYDEPITVTGITVGATPTVTAPSHGLSTGDRVLFQDIVGMIKFDEDDEIDEKLNNQLATITVTNANSFTIDIPTTGYSPYVSGGTIREMVMTISGLDHLEGEEVAVLADGAAHPPVTVASGAITLVNEAATVHVGYGYDSDFQLLRIDAGSANGTSIGKTRRTHRVGFMLHRTLGLKFGMNFDDMLEATFRTSDDLGDRAVELFTGIKSEEVEADHDFDNQLCVRQSDPLPMTILAIMPQMKVEDRQ